MHVFERDVSLTQQGDGKFQTNISGNWSINGSPNGGYLMALLLKAMTQCGQIHGVPIITANFIARSEVGAADVLVESISQSNRFARFEARLIQQGKERIRAFGTLMKETIEQVETHYGEPEPVVADLKECVLIPTLPSYTLYDNLEVRLDPTTARWMNGDLTGNSEIKGWIRFKKHRQLDALAAILFADSFPPAVSSRHGIVAWMPTIEFSVGVRTKPIGEWLRCVFKTTSIHNGMLEEDGYIWDTAGSLIAVSRQHAWLRQSR
jgi:hypothetical protein